MTVQLESCIALIKIKNWHFCCCVACRADWTKLLLTSMIILAYLLDMDWDHKYVACILTSSRKYPKKMACCFKIIKPLNIWCESLAVWTALCAKDEPPPKRCWCKHKTWRANLCACAWISHAKLGIGLFPDIICITGGHVCCAFQLMQWPSKMRPLTRYRLLRQLPLLLRQLFQKEL